MPAYATCTIFEQACIPMEKKQAFLNFVSTQN